VNFEAFAQFLSPIWKSIVEATAVLFPACSRMRAMNCVVVVLPFVPVTPITCNLFPGLPAILPEKL
jgi:hypothetical protein